MKIDELIQQAGKAADDDVSRVELAFETRIMAQVRESDARELELKVWARAFLGGAFASVVALAAIFVFAVVQQENANLRSDWAFAGPVAKISSLQSWE